MVTGERQPLARAAHHRSGLRQPVLRHVRLGEFDEAAQRLDAVHKGVNRRRRGAHRLADPAGDAHERLPLGFADFGAAMVAPDGSGAAARAARTSTATWRSRSAAVRSTPALSSMD